MQNTISQKGDSYQFDAIVIGSGIAGLCYILELLSHCPNACIALVTKQALQDSNTYYAQGGIAAVTSDDEADIELHVQDTLKAGDEFCNTHAVLSIIKQGQSSIDFLLKHGVLFDKDEENHLARGREAGHSHRRIYHVADQTGAAFCNALLQQIKKLPQVKIFEYHTAINLITQELPKSAKACMHTSYSPQKSKTVGVYVLAEKSLIIHTFLAKVIVFATGGAGKVYRYTTNPNTATGDGIAMAYRAGAAVSGMEFYQFHPTLLFHPKINNFLISEALRGEGAYLRLPDTNERFMYRYQAETLELSTRDIVARACFSEMEQKGYDFVYLDIRHRDKNFLLKRFPLIYRTLKKVGLDLSKDLIPVVPAAHYMGGGIVTDIHGRTDLNRLFAIGETAYTGLHGANRLASNSLLEGVVMSRNAARASIEYIKEPMCLTDNIKGWDSSSVVDLRRASQINVHWRGLRGEMSSYAGIIRTEAGLSDQLALVLARREMIEAYYWKYAITRDLIELRNIILIAELIVRAALNRQESRGVHYREDFPEKAYDYPASVSKNV